AANLSLRRVVRTAQRDLFLVRLAVAVLAVTELPCRRSLLSCYPSDAAERSRYVPSSGSTAAATHTAAELKPLEKGEMRELQVVIAQGRHGVRNGETHSRSSVCSNWRCLKLATSHAWFLREACRHGQSSRR